MTDQHYSRNELTSILVYTVYLTKLTSHSPLCTAYIRQPTSLLGPFVPPVSNFGSGNYSQINGNEAAVWNISHFCCCLWRTSNWFILWHKADTQMHTDLFYIIVSIEKHGFWVSVSSHSRVNWHHYQHLITPNQAIF